MSLEKGDLLHGRYRIVEILGHGGMGAVYRAMDENLAVEVAVKENLFTTDDYARQFRLEAVILASLRHHHLPRVTDHFVLDDQGQYLVMDFIAGEDLRQILERSGKIIEDEVTRIGVAICDALAYLHTRKPPILHRDIKLGNIKLTPDGNIVLVDFGLAKMADASEMTMTGARAMTPGYSPPEQYGTARTDARSDIYALGATLYAALTGFIPEDSLARVMDNVSLTPIRERNRNVSERLAKVIEKAMSTQPAERYQNAEEFKRALLGQPEAAGPVSDKELVAEPVKSAEKISEPAPDFSFMSMQQEVEPKSEPFQPNARTKRSGVGPWMFLLFLIALAAGGFYLYSNPALIPPQFQALIFTPTATATSTYTSTPTSTTTPTATATFTSTATATASATSTPRPTATFTQTPLPTATFVETETPTETATATETPTSTPTETPTATIQPIIATPIGSDSLEIAYASMVGNISQIFIMNLAENTPRQITNEPAGACQPAWSPNGEQIVFVSPCTENVNKYEQGKLFTLTLSTNEIKPVGVPGAGNFDPNWSPDGASIVFTSNATSYLQIYKVDIATNNITRLTQTSASVPSSQPAWSPDGKSILYTVRRLGLEQIWRMGSDGRNPAQYIRSGGNVWDSMAAWSSDGTFIYFAQASRGGLTDHWLMKWQAGSSTAPEDFEDINLPAMDVSVSPDGLWLAFESSDGNNQDIYLYNLIEKRLVRLTEAEGIDFDPAWRP